MKSSAASSDSSRSRGSKEATTLTKLTKPTQPTKFKMKSTLVLTLVLTLVSISYANPWKFRRFYDVVWDENSVEAAPLPSIDFTADWQEVVHGKLGVGRDFQINYAKSRLEAPVLVQYKFNDGPDFQSEPLGEPDDNDLSHAIISIPIDADKVVIWFKHENDPDTWDSDFGNNYHFLIEQPSIVFLNGYQEKQHGKLVPGGTFDLFYDSRRLKEGVQVEAQMKFVDDQVVGKTLQRNDEESPYQSAVISIPDDAEKVVLWFFYEENGKKHYDSDFGANYEFPLA